MFSISQQNYRDCQDGYKKKNPTLWYIPDTHPRFKEINRLKVKECKKKKKSCKQ